jgi:hypothetical protein
MNRTRLKAPKRARIPAKNRPRIAPLLGVDIIAEKSTLSVTGRLFSLQQQGYSDAAGDAR